MIVISLISTFCFLGALWTSMVICNEIANNLIKQDTSPIILLVWIGFAGCWWLSVIAILCQVADRIG